MKANQREQLKSKITRELAQLNEHIEALKEMTQPIAPENAIGRVSRMDAINNKSVNEAALYKAQQKLHKLEIALQKVDSATFGTCTRCGNTISEGRLLFMPESPTCVHCAGTR